MYEVAREEIEEILRGDTIESRMADPNQWAEQVVGPYERFPASHSMERRQRKFVVVRNKVFWLFFGTS
jgi:hypothetical protein